MERYLTIRLSGGYAISGDDGRNWRLQHSTRGRQRPKVLGYFPTVTAAAEAALKHVVMSRADVIRVRDLPRLIDSAVGQVTRCVTVAMSKTVQERARATTICSDGSTPQATARNAPAC